MKAKLTSLLLMLLVASIAFGQESDDDESSGKNHIGVRIGAGENAVIEASFRHKFIALLQMEVDAGYQWDDTYSLLGVNAALHLKLPLLLGIQIFAGPGVGMNTVTPEGGESKGIGVGYLQAGLQIHFVGIQVSLDTRIEEALFNEIPEYEGGNWNGALGIRLKM
ncbi:MAG TPA: hypothetical protein VIX80_10255 [Candidatus Kapabacteria bacterium]